MKKLEALQQALKDKFATEIENIKVAANEITIEVAAQNLLEVAKVLRDENPFNFEMLIDLCGVDYLTYGKPEWETTETTTTGFCRGRESIDEVTISEKRFAVVYHLLSIENNQRLRLKVFVAGEPPVIDSVIEIWNCANWYEREAFDLFGIRFKKHPDLRRILTDYGFIGNPFRKDFPLIGEVEMRYDSKEGRVIYEPVSIEARTLVPKVIRDDNRYLAAQESDNGRD